MIIKRIKHVEELSEISDIVQTQILCSLDGQILDVERLCGVKRSCKIFPHYCIWYSVALTMKGKLIHLQ